MSAIDTVEALLSSYYSQDHERTLGLITEEFTWSNVAIPKATVDSKEVMRQLLYQGNMGFPDQIETGHHVTLNAIADGDLVLHEWVDHWTLRGVEMDCPCAAVFTVVGDKVSMWKDYYDIGHVIRQFESVGFEIDTSKWF